jgi:sortase A
LGYCAAALLHADLYQFKQNQIFEKRLRVEANLHLSPSMHAAAGPAEQILLSAAARDGMPWGRIDIPRLGISRMILDGDDQKTLSRAIGHIPNTAFPGGPGNVGLAGHRDTFFRPLRNIRENDDVWLTTLNGAYRYRVEFTRIVKPEEVWVLRPSSRETLTLVTCYPFFYVGAAPQRFVVRATRIDSPDHLVSATVESGQKETNSNLIQDGKESS